MPLGRRSKTSGDRCTATADDRGAERRRPEPTHQHRLAAHRDSQPLVQRSRARVSCEFKTTTAKGERDECNSVAAALTKGSKIEVLCYHEDNPDPPLFAPRDLTRFAQLLAVDDQRELFRKPERTIDLDGRACFREIANRARECAAGKFNSPRFQHSASGRDAMVFIRHGSRAIHSQRVRIRRLVDRIFNPRIDVLTVGWPFMAYLPCRRATIDNAPGEAGRDLAFLSNDGRSECQSRELDAPTAPSRRTSFAGLRCCPLALREVTTRALQPESRCSVGSNSSPSAAK